MDEFDPNAKLIAYCGVYCGACKRYLRGECQNCFKMADASWCLVRACCMEHNYSTCADCTITDNIANCEKLIETSARNVLCLDFSPIIWNIDKNRKP